MNSIENRLYKAYTITYTVNTRNLYKTCTMNSHDSNGISPETSSREQTVLGALSILGALEYIGHIGVELSSALSLKTSRRRPLCLKIKLVEKSL